MSLLFFELSHRNHNTTESEERYCVGKYHQVIEHIHQLPDQIVGHQSAQEDEHQSNDGVDHGAGLGILLAEQVDHVDLTEHIPAEYGGEKKNVKLSIPVLFEF